MNYSDWYWLYAYERSYCSPAVHSAITQRLRDGDQGQKYPIPAGTIEGGTFIETIAGQIWWRVYPGAKALHMESEERAAPRYEGDRVAAVSQIQIEHAQQELTESYSMKLVYEFDSSKSFL